MIWNFVTRTRELSKSRTIACFKNQLLPLQCPLCTVQLHKNSFTCSDPVWTMELKMEFNIIYIHNFCFKKFGRIKFYVCLMNKLFDLMCLCNIIHNNFSSMIWLFYGNVKTNHNSVAQVVVVAAVFVVVVLGVVIVVNDIVFAQARFYI